MCDFYIFGEDLGGAPAHLVDFDHNKQGIPFEMKQVMSFIKDLDLVQMPIVQIYSAPSLRQFVWSK